MSESTHPNDRTDLQPITPEDAARMWVESRVDEWATATRELQKHQIEAFVEWLQANDVDNVNDVTGRLVHRYRLDIKDGLAPSTVSQRLSTVRRFLQFCTTIDAVPTSVPERIEIPSRDTEARDERLDPEHADAALQYLRKFAYASKHHAVLAVCWHTGVRTGTLRALDVDDFEPTDDRLRVRHRPETDTPLKNGETAERFVTLADDVSEVVADYVDTNRHDVTDEYGRHPLFTTPNGRPLVKTFRRWFEGATRPCQWRDCPHGRDPDDCDAAQRFRDASDCPSTVSGHPIRRGAITHHLREDVPEKVVSDRMNVSRDILDEHYDRRTADERAEQRRQYLDNI